MSCFLSQKVIVTLVLIDSDALLSLYFDGRFPDREGNFFSRNCGPRGIRFRFSDCFLFLLLSMKQVLLLYVDMIRCRSIGCCKKQFCTFWFVIVLLLSLLVFVAFPETLSVSSSFCIQFDRTRSCVLFLYISFDVTFFLECLIAKSHTCHSLNNVWKAQDLLKQIRCFLLPPPL